MIDGSPAFVCPKCKELWEPKETHHPIRVTFIAGFALAFGFVLGQVSVDWQLRGEWEAVAAEVHRATAQLESYRTRCFLQWHNLAIGNHVAVTEP